MKKLFLFSVAVLLLAACGDRAGKEAWRPLFNGENLDGWTVKITGYPVGDNFGDTFRVEDGLLKVRYDQYDEFDNRFGHIYTDETFSNYRLRVEYRFVGEQVEGGPDWAYRNSGAMLHCPAPETMSINQDFPVSVEAQMLGGNGTDVRTTANVCTPGTEIDVDGVHTDAHCVLSGSRTYHGDQWVTLEMIVYADSLIHHVMDGDTVLTYTDIIVAGGGVSPLPAIAPGPLKEGRISLQSESHPIDFRKVEIMELER